MSQIDDCKLKECDEVKYKENESKMVDVALVVHMFATGKKCTDRVIAVVGIKFGDTQQVFYIKTLGGIVSTLEPITGVSMQELQKKAILQTLVPLSFVKNKLKQLLPPKNKSILWSQSSKTFMQSYLKEIGLESYQYQSLAEKFRHKNKSHSYHGHKHSYQYFTKDVEYYVMCGHQKKTMSVEEQLDAILNLAASPVPSEKQSQRMRVMARQNEYRSFASQNAVDSQGVCTGHIASGKYGQSCRCGERTRKNKKW